MTDECVTGRPFFVSFYETKEKQPIELKQA